MLAAVGRIATAVDLPVTADLERGYGLGPVELVEGCSLPASWAINYEDTDHRGRREAALVDAAEQAEALAAIRGAADAAGVHVVINARVDTFVRGVDDALDETLRRGRLYLEAEHDCVYPIFMKDEAIGRVVAGLRPVNALLLPDGPSLPRLRRARRAPHQRGRRADDRRDARPRAPARAVALRRALLVLIGLGGDRPQAPLAAPRAPSRHSPTVARQEPPTL